MFWDSNTWVVIEPGEVALRASVKYAAFAAHMEEYSTWEEVPEFVIWPQRKSIPS